ncbi:MAG: HypC/HybG/HupF family hydrogenase formation chaperone [Candidatus Diapherotrites archaeon]|nr:HypC/HybG/HupF family hydrogenase formation chaperone [Candidatus Diapherotrites archaeon]
MCIAIVGKLVKVNGKTGVAKVDGKSRQIDMSLVDAKRGDFVSLALNLAVEKLEKKEALAILNARRGVIEAKR